MSFFSSLGSDLRSHITISYFSFVFPDLCQFFSLPIFFMTLTFLKIMKNYFIMVILRLHTFLEGTPKVVLSLALSSVWHMSGRGRQVGPYDVTIYYYY